MTILKLDQSGTLSTMITLLYAIIILAILASTSLLILKITPSDTGWLLALLGELLAVVHRQVFFELLKLS